MPLAALCVMLYVFASLNIVTGTQGQGHGVT